MILMLLWLLSKKGVEKLYGLTNVGLYTIFVHIETNKHLNNIDFLFRYILICLHIETFIAFFYFRDPKCLCLDNIEGFILNVPTEYKLGFVLLPLKRRHWIALKKIRGAFYNLDSKLDSPQLIGKVIKDNKYFVE